VENYKAQLLLGLHFWVLKLQLLKFRITDFSGQLLSFNSYYLSPKVKLKIPSLTKCGELKGATFVRLTFLRFEVATSEIANYWFFRSIIIFQLIIWVFANSFRTSSSSNNYQHRWFHIVILISSCEHFVEQVILNIQFQIQPQNSISQFPQLFTTSNTHSSEEFDGGQSLSLRFSISVVWPPIFSLYDFANAYLTYIFNYLLCEIHIHFKSKMH